MKKTEKGMSRIKFIIYVLIALGIIVFLAIAYIQENNFKDCNKCVLKQNISEFKRDNNTKYSDERSYRIFSPDYNDAMVTKTVKVQKNKSYRVTCMVKTQDVVAEIQNSTIGAQLAIDGTTTRSIAITGTHDWQKLEMVFNSQNREKVDIGLRLGSYKGNCKGTAWFSDVEIEQGVPDDSNAWKFACFIYNSTDVVIDGNNVQIKVTDDEISDIKNTISRFEDSCSKLSNGKMTAKCDIYNINSPITQLSYDEECGYYVAPDDVRKDIKSTLDANNYDHIFIIVRLGDEKHQNDIEIKDWIGLGSMDYYGIGFSNIRLPNNSKSYVYKYDSRVNTFPEEVFLHEFLHSLERTAKEYGYEIPELHDFEQYGYKIEALLGEKAWYTDYMNCNISANGTKIGLPSKIYTLKPAKESDFTFSHKMEKIF